MVRLVKCLKYKKITKSAAEVNNFFNFKEIEGNFMKNGGETLGTEDYKKKTQISKLEIILDRK